MTKTQLVRTGTGPIRQRRSGAGTHDSRPKRLRTRQSAKRADIKERLDK